MKILLKILKIFSITILSFFLFIGIMNIAKFAIYKQYYSIEESVCKNPGLNDGAIPQGVAVDENENIIYTTAYFSNDNASRIYIINSNNKTRYVNLYESENKKYTGHVGGIAYAKKKLYLTGDGCVYIINIEDLNNDKVILTNYFIVNNDASFISITNNYLYVGEFSHGSNYVTNHEISVKNDTYYAICSVYSLDDLDSPIRIYSIPNKVQGFCVTDKGTIVLSSSYAVASSKYYIFYNEDIEYNNETYEGIPLIKLDSPSKVIKGPAMSEDLEFANGKIYCLTESASNKYIFGKFFFANKIYTLNIE